MKKYFIVICKILPYLIYSYFSWILPYSRHPEKYDVELRFKKAQILIRKVLIAFRTTFNEINFDKFNSEGRKDQSRFIVCNHISDCDPLLFIALSNKPVTFVAKKETRKFLFVGRIIRALGGEFLDRSDLKQELRVFINIRKRMISEPNVDWVIFPEGTRNKTDILNVQEFKNGAFKYAMKAEAPIYIFSILGSQRILDIKCKNKYYPVQIKLNKVITKEDYQNLSTVEVSSISHEACDNGVKEISKFDEDMVYTLNN